MKAFFTKRLEIPMVVIILAAIVMIALLVGLVLQNGIKSEVENLLVLPAAAGPPPLSEMDTWNIVYKDIRDGYQTTRLWACVDPGDSRFENWTFYQTYAGFYSACLNQIGGTR